MRRQLVIFLITLIVLAGSVVATGATVRQRDDNLRGYVDPVQTADLPYRQPTLGVNAELTQYSASALTQQLDLMRQAHITWVRQFFRWDDIEPLAGVYAWDQWDAVVQVFADDPDLKLVAVLMNSPAWARDGENVTTPPRDPADFAAFARAFAERYGSTIDFYQIWDEPNLSEAWGGADPRPTDYLALLSAGYSAIHGADSGATVIAAALAPTTETGPRNLSDIDYLNDLYALGAADVMDATAAKPFGFNLSPDDRTVRADTLNFSRLVALREVMTEHGDDAKALWLSSWGWNSLPADWSGAPSIWGSVTADQQVSYTLAALDRIDREMPYVAGAILYHWQPDVPTDDPHWGFALMSPATHPLAYNTYVSRPRPLWEALANRTQPAAAADGLFFPANTYARYSGVWTFGALGADIGWVQDSQLDFTFQGSDLALLLRQGDYVALLYATIDGQPANALPYDANGNTFINLTSGDQQPHTSLVTVARNLGTGVHTLHLAADRGWDQWALAGFAVSSGDLAAPYDNQIAVAILTAVIAALASVATALRFDWQPLTTRTARLWERLGSVGQIAISVITSLALMIGMLLTWSDSVPTLFRREPVQLGLAILTAGLIYVQPHLLITLAALIVLFVIVYQRVDLGLMLTIFYAPFFLFPVELYKFAFPMSELLVLLTGAAWLLRSLAGWGRTRQSAAHFPATSVFARLTALDVGVAAWVILGAISLAWAAQRGAALTELRTLILEPSLFYLMLRATSHDRRTLLRLVDALLIAGALVAMIGLYQYVNGDAIITAEAGARRLASVYGSPNNVGLFLGRCIPFLLAFALVPTDLRRRLLAGGALVIVLIAALLSQSAGALFIGIPAAVATVLLLILGKRGILAILGLLGVGAVGAAIALRTERFAHVLDFSTGTNFFRIRVWQSAIEMIRDHPITGSGTRPVSLRLSRALHSAGCVARAEFIASTRLSARLVGTTGHHGRDRLRVASDRLLATRLCRLPARERRPARARAGRRDDGQHDQPVGARLSR